MADQRDGLAILSSPFFRRLKTIFENCPRADPSIEVYLRINVVSYCEGKVAPPRGPMTHSRRPRGVIRFKYGAFQGVDIAARARWQGAGRRIPTETVICGLGALRDEAHTRLTHSCGALCPNDITVYTLSRISRLDVRTFLEKRCPIANQATVSHQLDKGSSPDRSTFSRATECHTRFKMIVSYVSRRHIDTINTWKRAKFFLRIGKARASFRVISCCCWRVNADAGRQERVREGCERQLQNCKN